MKYAVLYNDNDIEIDRHELNLDFTLSDVIQMWDIYVGDKIVIECDDLEETSDMIF